jgi:hypothetical protein
VKFAISANTTVVSGCRSAIGALLSFLLFASCGYSLSRTLEGKRDSTMAFDRCADDINFFAVETRGAHMPKIP